MLNEKKYSKRRTNNNNNKKDTAFWLVELIIREPFTISLNQHIFQNVVFSPLVFPHINPYIWSSIDIHKHTPTDRHNIFHTQGNLRDSFTVNSEIRYKNIDLVNNFWWMMKKKVKVKFRIWFYDQQKNVNACPSYAIKNMMPYSLE